MAQKNIIYDINGKVKESTGNIFDDSTDNLTLKNVTYNSMSVNLPDGIAFISGTTISSSGAVSNNSSIIWNSSLNRWVVQPPTVLDVVSLNSSIPPSSDITGSFNVSLQVKSLSNVNSGSALSVQYGGTGLNTSSIPEGESLLIGNGTGSFNFITASNLSNISLLASSTDSWSFITQSSNAFISEIQIFTASATWTRPQNTFFIRVLAQGGGGGGGSGANRNGSGFAGGGSGAGSGAFIDTGIFQINHNTVNIVVGSGGTGANYPSAGAAGTAGTAGTSSSFGNYIFAAGGAGGGGGLLTVAGTTGGTGGAITHNLYDVENFYNSFFITDAGGTGANSTTTAGSSITIDYDPIATTYYGVGGGAGGGAVTASVAYDGGRAGLSIFNSGSVTFPDAGAGVSSSVISLIESNISSDSQYNNIFISSGGGGGASSTTTNGGRGGDGFWGSGGGGGGASTNGSSGTRQGGNGGNGYVAVVIYKF